MSMGQSAGVPFSLSRAGICLKERAGILLARPARKQTMEKGIYLEWPESAAMAALSERQNK